MKNQPPKLIDKNHLDHGYGLMSAFSEIKSIHAIKIAKRWDNVGRFQSQFLNIFVYLQLIGNSTQMNGAIICNYKTVS